MAQNYCARERTREEKVRAQLAENRIDMREMERRNLELRAEHRRYNRFLYSDRKEVEMEERILKAKEAEIKRRCQLEQEEQLAQQISNMKRTQMREVKLRQHLRENNMELRELEAHLNRAYARKALLGQCAERRAAELEERRYERFVKKKMEEEFEKDKSYEEKKAKELCENKLKLRRELQDQLISNEKARRRDYYEFLEEKRVVDEITAQVIEEDNKAEREECLKKRRTKEEMEEFLKMQAEMREKKRKQLEEEDKRVLGYVEQKTKQQEEHRRDQLMKLNKQEEVAFMIGTRLFEQELEKMEHADMMDDLHVMQAQGAAAASQRAEQEAKVRKRFQLRQESMEQARIRYEFLQREADMDRMWTQEMLAKFAEDDRLEQLTLQKRWEKQQEHRRAVQQMLEERKVERAAEAMRMMKAQEEEDCEEEQRKKIVQEERLRMLREHAENVLGYLPNGVIKPDDLVHLGCDLADKMKALEVSPICYPVNADPLPKYKGYED